MSDTSVGVSYKKQLSKITSFITQSWQLSGSTDHTIEFGSERVATIVAFLLSFTPYTTAYLSVPQYDDKTVYAETCEIVLFVGFDGLSEKETEEMMNEIAKSLVGIFGVGIVVYEEKSLPAEPDKDDRLRCLKPEQTMEPSDTE